ncbi:MAG: type II secretion system F family protein [Gammaproteobacteria bacterium]|nr:type II secretion system F family protein [Gammaproteobacteria bacterium]
MPRFLVRAADSNGRIFSKEVEADSARTAIAYLQDTGHHPLSAEEVTVSSKASSLSLRIRRRSVKRRDVASATRELATLLTAGMPLDSALVTLERLLKGTALHEVIVNVREGVQRGQALGEALQNHSDVFDSLYLNTVRAGEASGELAPVLERFADYLERMADLRSTVVTSLIYPAILLIVSVMSLFALLLFVVPQFVPLFEDTNQPLPLITRFVFWVAAVVGELWWLLLLLTVAAVFLAKAALSNPGWRRWWDLKVLEAPILGNVIQDLEIARISRTLGTLLKNGVPLLAAVRQTRGVVQNFALEEVLSRVETSLERGMSFAGPVRESGLIPATATQLIAVGEESGQLNSMLMKVAEIYDQHAANGIKRCLTLLEPILILGLGALIATIIISILLAILSLQNLVA